MTADETGSASDKYSFHGSVGLGRDKIECQDSVMIVKGVEMGRSQAASKPLEL
jgi:hypothetical protein